MDTLKNALEGNKWEKAIPKEIQDMVFGDLNSTTQPTRGWDCP